MEEFYKILNNYYTLYESALGRNPKKANSMRSNIEILNLTLNRFMFLCAGGRYTEAKPLLKKMNDLLHVDRLSPIRKLDGADLQKYFRV